MKIQDVMTVPVRTCRPDDGMNVAAAVMWESDCGCVPVVDAAGRAVGMITDRDICMAAYTQGQPLSEMPVSRAMSRVVYTCPSDATLADAEQIMSDHRVRRLPVVSSGGVICGIVTMTDVVRAASRSPVERAREVLGGNVLHTMAAICGPGRAAARA